jgi:large subunit ribosomal protein L4
MPKAPRYNSEGKQTGDVELNAAHFGVAVNQALIHEIVIAQQANARHPIAHTKTRGEIRGGGKKPWKQKGTGRARHGSTRSPIWVGGGITFGPRNVRNFGVKVNRKAKQKALFMALSDKLAHGKFLVVDKFAPEAVKTKALALLMKRLPVGSTVLYVAAGSRPELVRMARNLKRIFVVTANAMSIVDILRFKTVIFEADAVDAFEKIHAKNA